MMCLSVFVSGVQRPTGLNSQRSGVPGHRRQFKQNGVNKQQQACCQQCHDGVAMRSALAKSGGSLVPLSLPSAAKTLHSADWVQKHRNMYSTCEHVQHGHGQQSSAGVPQ